MEKKVAFKRTSTCKKHQMQRALIIIKLSLALQLCIHFFISQRGHKKSANKNAIFPNNLTQKINTKKRKAAPREQFLDFSLSSCAFKVRPHDEFISEETLRILKEGKRPSSRGHRQLYCGKANRPTVYTRRRCIKLPMPPPGVELYGSFAVSCEQGTIQ